MISLTTTLETEFLKNCETITHGSLTVITPEKIVHHFGQGKPEAEFQIHDWRTISMVLARGDIGFGEAYIDGYWDSASPETLITLVLLNQHSVAPMRRPNFWNTLKYRLLDRVIRRNSRTGSSRNIRQHYDVGNEFYQLWLDDTMTYSSAIFEQGDDLQTGQLRKYNRILNRLGDQGERVLEIGCGWGGFADQAAKSGRHVTGLTLSPSQQGYASALLDGAADINLRDYRDASGQYDHIVSIEMVEAVGERYWPTYFSTLKARLKQDGKAVIQAITVQDKDIETYRQSSDFIRHHIFPGGMLLSKASIETQAAKVGMKVTDHFDFGKDYGRTCTEWSTNMMAAAPRIHKLGHDTRFLRSWRYYLDSCAASFYTNNTSVVQMELQHV
jgi:cyclopropane-fatty-acyl-phospholipid synthase